MKKLRREARNAIALGGMCSLSYLAVYFARDLLSPLTLPMIESQAFTEQTIANLSSVFFIAYAVGQLVNGIVGDKVKAKYMISLGLILAGVCSFVFPFFAGTQIPACVAYGMVGFFLSMIYAPMSKLVAENTEPIHATRCALGYTFASFIGRPLAGVAALVFVWQDAFRVSSAALIIMGSICFLVFCLFERRGVIQYSPATAKKEEGKGVKALFRHHIVKFTGISILTGIIRTSVVFWLPVYLSDALPYSPEAATLLASGITLVLSSSAFVSLLFFEALKRDLDLTVFLCFVISAVCFVLVFFTRQLPGVNAVLLALGILANCCSSSMMWNRYCPSLRDTGMVSTATGFLDFVHYMAASAANAIFPGLKTVIGWNGLILVWLGLMVTATLISIPLPGRKKTL